MLRLIFVWTILVFGGACALYSTFNSLLFYLWYGYFRPEDWVWSWSIWALGLSWWIGALLVVRAAFTPQTYRLSGRSLLLFLMLLHTFLSLILSDYSETSLEAWTDFVKIIVVAHLVATLPNDPRKFRIVLVVIALSLGFEATKQGYTGLILHPGAKNYNSIRFLGDENGVAIGMLMLVPILAALAGTTQRLWERRLFQFMLIGVLYRGIVTYSRGGFVGAMALGVIYLARSKQRLRSLVGVAVLVAIIAPALPPAFWDRMNTITLNEEEMDASSAGRMHFWRVAMNMANDRPVTGVGYNAFNAAFDDYDFLEGAMGTGKNHHSVWFGTIAELGYPGLFLFAANVFLSIRACRRIRRHALQGQVPAEIGKFAMALEAALWVPPIGGAFVAFQYSEMLWHFFGLTIALEAIANQEASKSTAPEVAPDPTAVEETEPPAMVAFRPSGGPA